VTQSSEHLYRSHHCVQRRIQNNLDFPENGATQPDQALLQGALPQVRREPPARSKRRLVARCRPLHRAPKQHAQHALASGKNRHADPEVAVHCSPRRRLLHSRALGPTYSLRLWREARGFAVRLRSLVEAWNQFFFAPQSPLPIALFRIAYGLLVIATLTLLRPDWLAWYGPHPWVSLSTM